MLEPTRPLPSPQETAATGLASSAAVSTDDHHALLSLADGAERLEPLVALARDRVSVLLRVNRPDLSPGARIPRVCLFAAGECVLMAEGVVVQTPTGLATARPPRGATVLTIKLRATTGHERGAPGAETYATAEAMALSIAGLVQARAAVSVASPGYEGVQPPTQGSFVQMDPQRRWLLVQQRTDTAVHPGAAYELSTELYGARLQLTAVLQHAGPAATGPHRDLRFAWPQSMQVQQRRARGRLRKTPAPVRVELRLPFSEQRDAYDVLDVAPRGIGFLANSEARVIPGMRLSSLVVRLPSGNVEAAGTVRHVRLQDSGEQAVGVLLERISEANRRLLDHFIETNLNPQVRAARATDLRALWGLFDELGLVDAQRADRLRHLQQFEGRRHTLLTRGQRLFVQLVGGDAGQIESTAELLRLFERTFSLLHVASSGRGPVQAQQLVQHLMSAAATREDLTYVHALVDPEKDPLGLGRLERMALKPNSVSWRRWTLLEGEARDAMRMGSGRGQPASPADSAWIAERLHGMTGELERRALCLEARTLLLPEVQRAYRASGLERRRALRIAMGVTDILGFSVLEVLTPGVCLHNETNLARLFPTARLPGNRQTALLELAADAGRVAMESNTPRVRLLVAPDDAQPLAQRGLSVVGARLEVVATRQGAAQILQELRLPG